MTSLILSASGRYVRRFFVPALALAGLSLSLTGCGGSSNIRSQIPSLICPAIGIVKDTSVATRFREGGGYWEEDVLYRAHISDLTTHCRMDGGDVLSEIGFNVTAQKGQASGSDLVSLAYYVAVVSIEGDLIAKEVFNTVLDLSVDNRAAVHETVTQRLIIDEQRLTIDYEILIGLQLSDDDLVYNLAR